MPGVPSSKGCDACRKVKKKCDELQPCSRCLRLQIDCVGSGQQRFKFKNAESTVIVQAAPRRTRPVSRAKRLSTSKIVSPLSMDSLSTSFVHSLKISDIRYDLAYYGPFLHDIPRRLGSSRALDASVKTLVTAYPYFHGRGFPPSVFVNFGSSLRALRECLSDPVEARSSNTLCAVYLITICQSWLGKYDDQLTSHGEAIAHMLRMADPEKCQNKFERDILMTLSIPVILESISNPRVRMEPSFWEKLVSVIRGRSAGSSDTRPRPTTDIFTLAKFPDFIRDPDSCVSEMAATYLQIRDDSRKMRQYLDNWSPTQTEDWCSVALMQRSRYQAGYCLVITLGLILNTLLRAFDPQNEMLAQESAFYCDEIIDEAELASCYRPLGAAYMALCLVIALASVENPAQHARIETILADYQTDFSETRWRDRAMWLRATFESHRLRIASGSGVRSPDGVVHPSTCCMM
ncbi:hypothetical protein N7492_002684 [Penicillium capsulatum]|uniref:Zn(2)-C6 fungal-type domain-containing protein n=1 Tax=Penicillium capsulatum TaxID=69766 RepID=A0A9W9II91_9EURO|nr:hypothetical protein N7492_002684 [Penicillium capsulatum]KAJ6122718.1 hypothetical protein N7512_005183 [Penicillium capsulatum]